MNFLQRICRLKRLWLFCRVRGVKSLRFLYWYITEFKKFSSYLGKYLEVTDLRPFKILHWHSGCNCFTASYLQDNAASKIFIKMGGVFELASREAMAINLVKPYLACRFCVPAVIDYETDDNYSFVATSFIESRPLSVDTVLMEAIKSAVPEDEYIAEILKQMLDIIDALYFSRVVHRDVRPDNLLLSHNPDTGLPQLCLIDFAFSVGAKGVLPPLVLGEQREAILATLGEIWKPDKYVWDDAYSFYVIAKNFSSKFVCEEIDLLMSSISGKIGKLEHRGLDSVLIK